MLLRRIKDLLEGGSELFRAETELASRRFRRLLIGSALALLGVMVMLGGLAIITAGIAVEIAQHLGWGLSLIIVGASVTLVCATMAVIALAAFLVMQRVSDDEARDPKSESPISKAQQAKAKMANAANLRSTPDQQQQSSESLLDELKGDAIRYACRNPMLIGSGALVLISVIGPRKAIRMIGRGAAAAGLAGTILDLLSSEHAPGAASQPAPDIAHPDADASDQAQTGHRARPHRSTQAEPEATSGATTSPKANTKDATAKPKPSRTPGSPRTNPRQRPQTATT